MRLRRSFGSSDQSASAMDGARLLICVGLSFWFFLYSERLFLWKFTWFVSRGSKVADFDQYMNATYVHILRKSINVRNYLTRKYLVKSASKKKSII